MTHEIDPKYKLPCDFIVGHIRYRKGVQLETVRKAAVRWLAAAMLRPTPSGKAELERLLNGMSEENRHPES